MASDRADDNSTFEIGGTQPLDLDQGIPHAADDEIDVSFVDDALEEAQAAVQARPGQNERRGQNEDAYTPDPHEHERERWSQREREFAEREDRYGRAIAEAELRRVQTERESAQVAIDGIDLRIRTATEAIKAAKIDGDVSAEVDFANQLQELRNVRNRIVEMQGQLPSDQQIQQQYETWRQEMGRNRQQQAAASAPVGAVPGNELATRFLRANSWVSQPQHAQARDYMVQVDRQLAAEGFDPKSPQHFEELSRRVAARFPAVGIRTLDGRTAGTVSNPSTPSRPQSPPVASARSSVAPANNGIQNRNGKVAVQLNGVDRQMMRTMGLDPSDKAVQKRFAREKMMRLQMERR